MQHVGKKPEPSGDWPGGSRPVSSATFADPQVPVRLRSVRLKVQEAHYFLEAMATAGMDQQVMEFNLNAYASAARSVTFTLQAAMHDIEQFDEWYAPIRARLRVDPIARLFLELRNESQKEGASWIPGGIAIRDESGELQPHYCFTRIRKDGELVFACDVLGLARAHLARLVDLVAEVETHFTNAGATASIDRSRQSSR